MCACVHVCVRVRVYVCVCVYEGLLSRVQSLLGSPKVLGPAWGQPPSGSKEHNSLRVRLSGDSLCPEPPSQRSVRQCLGLRTLLSSESGFLVGLEDQEGQGDPGSLVHP